jgi:hypothetical protein
MLMRKALPDACSSHLEEMTMLWLKKVPVSVTLLTLLVLYFFATGAI